jgi:hypothetical protein
MGRWLMSLGCLAALIAVALAVNSSPAPAKPDPKLVHLDPNKQYPDEPDPPAGGIDPSTSSSPTNSAAVASSERKEVKIVDTSNGTRCTVGPPCGFARVREQPGDLVEGNAITHTTLDKQVADSTKSWAGGYVYWELGGCGWILFNDLQPKTGTPTGACASPSRLRTDIGYVWNARSNCEPPPGTMCDGEHTAVSCDPVPEYANVRPWSTAPTPGTLIRLVANPGHVWEVYWRYATKEPAHAWVMARDPHIAATDGNWVFIPSACFAGFGLPKAVAMTNP